MQINKTLIFAILSFAILAGLVSAAPSLNFVPPTSDNDIITDGTIDYNALLSDVEASNVVDFDVILYTSSFSYVYGDTDWSGVSNVEGSFLNIADGNYILFASATFLDGQTIDSMITLTVDKEYSVDNPISILFSDPTPENNALINSHNIGSAMIVAVGDEILDEMTINFYNDSGFVTSELYSEEKRTDYMIHHLWMNFGDGLYTFNVTAVDDSVPGNSKTRTFMLKATVPNVTEYNASFPSTVNEDASFSVVLSDVLLSEGNVTLGITASNNVDYDSLSSNDVEGLTADSLTFSGNIANPGVYNLTLTVSDDYGNSNSYSLGEITVNDVAEPNPVEERRRGRGGSNNAVVNDTTPTSRFNLTLIDLNEETEEETEEETQEETESEPGFFSFITGAVTGAFSTPPRAVLTFIILVVIIYAIIKIRGYIVADSNENNNKPKKNGKKAKKEEAEESESN